MGTHYEPHPVDRPGTSERRLPDGRRDEALRVRKVQKAGRRKIAGQGPGHIERTDNVHRHQRASRRPGTDPALVARYRPVLLPRWLPSRLPRRRYRPVLPPLAALFFSAWGDRGWASFIGEQGIAASPSSVFETQEPARPFSASSSRMRLAAALANRAPNALLLWTMRPRFLLFLLLPCLLAAQSRRRAAEVFRKESHRVHARQRPALHRR